MKTKVLILFLLMLGMDIMLVSCCRCTTGTFQYTLTELSMLTTDTENPLEDSTVIERSDFRVQMKIEADIKRVVENSHSGFLISNAIACKCPEDNIVRKRSISKIEMLCDKSVWEINAGDTIKNLFVLSSCYNFTNRQFKLAV